VRNIEFVTPLHSSTKRDYIARVNEFDKSECALVAKKFGKDYWDGPRQYGYGGYSYDGRWKTVAEEMIKTYDLKDDAKILDVGCGKGFLLYEFTQLLPNCTVQGLDISQHAIDDAKPEVKEFIKLGHAKDLPFEDNSFDLIISNTTLHNLKINELYSAVSEITRVTAKDSWICVESYRNESEKVNLMYWQLTCESFYSPEEWLWIYEQNGYKGDYEFIYFE
jgi:protein-L-isoaspartate(D-aspartate) O-methyltransferase